MIGARILACQKRLIAELRADGHDTTSAEAVLSTLIATQHIFEDHVRLILKENGLGKRESASIMPVSFQPSHYSNEPRSAKMDRVACAMSAGWMIRAAQPAAQWIQLPWEDQAPPQPASVALRLEHRRHSIEASHWLLISVTLLLKPCNVDYSVNSGVIYPQDIPLRTWFRLAHHERL